MIARAAHEINMKERPLLIIDEAGKITHPVMLYLHDLRKRRSQTVAWCLRVCHISATTCKRTPDEVRRATVSSLRRINLWHRLEGLSASEVMYIAREQGVSDERRLKEMSSKRRFGDLMNEILLDKVLKTIYEHGTYQKRRGCQPTDLRSIPEACEGMTTAVVTFYVTKKESSGAW